MVMLPESEPPPDESELAFEELAGAALAGLKDFAEGRILEGAELEKVLSDCLKRSTEALRGVMQPAEDAVCDWHWKAVR